MCVKEVCGGMPLGFPLPGVLSALPTGACHQLRRACSLPLKLLVVSGLLSRTAQGAGLRALQPAPAAAPFPPAPLRPGRRLVTGTGRGG